MRYRVILDGGEPVRSLCARCGGVVHYVEVLGLAGDEERRATLVVDLLDHLIVEGSDPSGVRDVRRHDCTVQFVDPRGRGGRP